MGRSLSTSGLAADEQLISRLREHGPALREQFGVRRLRVFGSLARGSAGPESDVDVLVDFQAPASAKRFYGLQFSLEDLLGRSVDLVSEKALPEEFRLSVEADAIDIDVVCVELLALLKQCGDLGNHQSAVE